MTNVVVNNLNNMEEMLLSGAKVQTSIEKSVDGMDKSTDFNAIFDKSVSLFFISAEYAIYDQNHIQVKKSFTRHLVSFLPTSNTVNKSGMNI